MKSKIFISMLCGMSLLGVASCSHDDDPTVFIPNAHEVRKQTFYILDEPFVSTFTVNVTPSQYPDPNPAGLNHDATVYVAADLAKVETFNKKMGSKYVPMPEGAFEVASSGIIKAGSTQSQPIEVAIDGKDRMEPFTDYMLPVSITGGDGISIDRCCQTIYLVFRGSQDASGAILFDRSEWKVIAASSEEPREGEWGHSGLKEACLDDDTYTFWGTDWSDQHPAPPHWIIFDLGETKTISGYSIQAREEGSDAPKDITLEVSDNGEEWSQACVFFDLEARGENRSFLPKAVSGRYVRLTITAVYGGPHVTVSEFNLF